MKQIQVEAGGRPFNWDDLLTVQQELTDAVQAQFLGRGPFVLSGCAVSGPATGATISAGIVCLDGQLLRFAGASGVALPAQFQAGAALLTDSRPYQTGGSKNCMREVPAVVVATNATYTGGEFLPVDTWGAKTWAHIQAAQPRTVNEVQWLASLTTADYDTTTGLGLPGTAAWGWGLCDGQNGRADLRGQFVVGYDATSTDYGKVGNQGGAPSVRLTAAQNGKHNHTNGNGQFDYNRLSRLAPLNSKTTAHDPDGEGNGGSDLDTVTSAAIQDSGNGDPHENRPPYYVLAARQWVGY